MTTSPTFKTPGQLIQKLLDDRGWTQRVLSIVLDVHDTTINKLIAGKRNLDAELALELSEVFGIDPEELLTLQKNYELAQAKIKAIPDPRREQRAYLFGDLPIAEMLKRGWLEGVESVKDLSRVEESVKSFFGANSIDEITPMTYAAKRTNVFGSATPTQMAWIYRVRQIASEMLVPKYNAKALRSAVGKLSMLLHAPEEIRKVPRILGECGVRFVIVETLTNAKIDGVCVWLNEHSPVIGMSLRFDRIDNFWFVLRHEIEHVLQDHGKRSLIMLDAELEGSKAGTGNDIADEERVANAAAAEFCVKQSSLEKFVARKYPFFAERDIIGFSRTLNIHPGLVAGQLQRRTERYDRFRKHLVKIRSSIAPGAIVDGWGDVAPVNL